MADTRFDGYPTDARFPSPGVDNEHDGYPTDNRFPSPGTDTRFDANLVRNGSFNERGPELVVNGGFGADSNWTKGDGWTISGGQAVCDGTQAAVSYLIHTPDIISSGLIYQVTFTVTERTAGEVFLRVGDVNTENVSAPGTYTYTIDGITQSGTVNVGAREDFVGAVDNISCQEVGIGWTYGTGWRWENNQAVCDGTQTGSTSLGQANTLTAGTEYVCTFEVTEVTAGQVRIQAGNVGGTWRTAPGKYTQTLTAGAATAQIIGDLNFVGAVDNVSFTEVLPASETDQTLPSTHTLVPAEVQGGPNAGYYKAVAGSLTAAVVNGLEILRLQSFGENWCMVDLDPLSTENLWPGANSITVTFSGAWSGTGTLTATTGYSYGGNVSGIQAGLTAAIGQNVNVTIEAV